MRLFNCNYCFYVYFKRVVLIFVDIFSFIVLLCYINFIFVSFNLVYFFIVGYFEKRGWRNL